MNRLDTFHFQNFIPEENRGGTFHVTVFKDGEYSPAMTPAQAEKEGFTLPAIMEAINLEALRQNDELRRANVEAQDALERVTSERDAFAAQLAELGAALMRASARLEAAPKTRKRK